MKIPSRLIPLCPRCGSQLTTNLRVDDKFVEDEGWHTASERYENFLRTKGGQKLLFLELGVGYNTPVSYTHLDVYKRQVIVSRIFTILKKFLP